MEGLDELRAALLALPGKLRRQALRNALAAGGRVFRDEARRLSPVLQVPVKRTGRVIRKPGTLRQAISVRTSKRDRRAGNVGVFVNVKPAKKGARGMYSPDDPFYWRWLEFGRSARAAVAERFRVGREKLRRTKGIRARRPRRAVGPIAAVGFLRGSTAKLNDALQLITKRLGPAIDRMNRKGGTR